MWSRAIRGVNFFSPQRKAMRDSAFRLRNQRLRESRIEKRVERLEASLPPIPGSEGEKSVLTYSNEELVRKNPRLRRMIARPTATLPRRHYLFIKNGSVPLSLDDLSVPSPSIFDESKIGEILREKTKEVSSKKDDSWLFKKQPKKGLKVVEWKQKFKSEDIQNAPLSNGSSSISGVLDLPSSDRRNNKATDPELLSKKILGPTSNDYLRIEEDRSLTSTASNLISLLKEKAVVYSQTGINPDLLDSVKKAMEQYPGIERRRRFEELAACQWTVQSLVEEGRCSVENFNILIRSYGFRNQVDEAFAVHDSMLNLGFTPDTDSYVSLIVASGADADRARSAYLLMRQQLISPSEKVYGALIKAHIRAGDVSSGFSLLRKMEDEGLMPSSPVIYTTLLDGLVRGGKTEVAWSQFRSWRTWRQVKPDAVMFSVMIRACTKNYECEQALGLLDDLRVSGEYPTDITYSHLIECMSTRTDFAEKAFEFFKQMKLEGFEMNSIVAKALVRACSRLGDVGRLRKTVKEICNAGIPLTSSMYADAIETIATSMKLNRKNVSEQEKGVNLRLAWYMVADLKEKGVTITTPILNALMTTYAAADYLDQAVATLEQFESFQVAPNAKTYEIILEELGKRSDVGRFFALFDQTKHLLSDHMFHIALDMAIETRSSKTTVAVLEGMVERKIRPLPAAAEKLAVVGRKIVQIHQVIGKMVAQNRDETHARMSKEHALINLEIEEHRTRVGHIEGKTDLKFETPENEAKRLYWDKKDKTRKNPRLARKDYLQVKKKGGDMHALKVDKPRPNLLADV